MSKMTLKAARANANLLQTDVARELSVNKCTVSKWENGITFPTVLQFAALCKLYGVSMEDIFLPTPST